MKVIFNLFTCFLVDVNSFVTIINSQVNKFEAGLSYCSYSFARV